MNTFIPLGQRGISAAELQPDGENKQGEPGFLHEIESGSVHQLAKVTGE